MTVAALPRWMPIGGRSRPKSWRRAAPLGAVILGLHVIGFAILLALATWRFRRIAKTWTAHVQPGSPRSPER